MSAAPQLSLFPKTYAPRRRPTRSLFPAVQRRDPWAGSSAAIEAVMQHADEEEDLGDGRVVRRISRRRLSEVAVPAKAAEIAVIYDAREDQVVEVTARPKPRPPVKAVRPFDEDDDCHWAFRRGSEREGAFA
jgi:hypothetical protein